MFPSCHPPLGHLLEELPRLQPRSYSITSSSDLYPTTMHIAFTLVNYHAPVPPAPPARNATAADGTPLAAALALASADTKVSAVSSSGAPSTASSAAAVRKRKGLCTNWLLALCEVRSTC